MVDVDHSQAVNDVHGHAGGDDLLQRCLAQGHHFHRPQPLEAVLAVLAPAPAEAAGAPARAW
jgi:predicted signal transduction protein with EAL and GGDEF domain